MRIATDSTQRERREIWGHAGTGTATLPHRKLAKADAKGAAPAAGQAMQDSRQGGHRQTTNDTERPHAGAESGPLTSPRGRLQLWAAVAPGLEALAQAELRDLGAGEPRLRQRGIGFSYPAARLVDLLQRLRTVEQVLVHAGKIDLHSADALPRLLQKLRNLGWLTAQSPVDIKVHALAGATDKAAWWQHQVDAGPGLQRQASGATVTNSAGLGQVVHVRCDRRHLEISLDPAGSPLSHRGYRLDPGEAPLRETTAALLLRWAGMVPGLAVWDPLCGSGTLAIEAALWGQAVQRDFACHDWPGLEVQAPWPRQDLSGASLVQAGDLSAAAAERCRANAERAGVLRSMTIRQAEMGEWRDPCPAPQGLVVSNLPWGVRLGSRAEARRLAQRWAAVVKRRVPGWRAAAVVAEPQLAAELGLLQSEVLATRSGGRAVWLVKGVVPGRTA